MYFYKPVEDKRSFVEVYKDPEVNHNRISLNYPGETEWYLSVEPNPLEGYTEEKLDLDNPTVMFYIVVHIFGSLTAKDFGGCLDDFVEWLCGAVLKPLKIKKEEQN